MKTKLLITILFFLGIEAKAQTVDKTMYDNVYYFVTSATLQQCSGDGTVPKDNPISTDIGSGAQFKITKILASGDFVIHISVAKKPGPHVKDVAAFNSNLVYKATTNTGQKQGDSGKGGNSPFSPDPSNYIYLYLPATVFNASCDLPLKRNAFALGALTLPIKIRPGEKLSNGTYRDFSFESDISIGLSIGYKFAPNKHDAYNILTGIDLTSVPVTPETTNNAVTAATNLSAITWHLGFLFQIDNFQIGAFTGIDYLAGNTGRQWMYRNDMWLGVGLGYSIFSPKKTTDTQ